MIIKNIIKTPDGTILESSHVHDFKMHKDENGEIYINDGGTQYIRRSLNIIPYDDLSIYATDDITIIREIFTWGTYGKDGKDALKRKKLSELSNDHIDAILNTQKHLSNKVLDIFKRELNYRNANKIFIED